MIRPPLEKVLEALIDTGRPLLRKNFHERCCVAGTRLTVTVLEAAGYVAEPTACHVRAGNREFVEDVIAAKGQPIDVEMSYRKGVRYVEVGADPVQPEPDEKPGYAAHLVTVCQNVLIDLTSEQMNRPHKRIHVPDWIVLGIPDGLPAGQMLDGGGVITYDALDDPQDWRRAPDWATERTDPIAKAVLKTDG